MNKEKARVYKRLKWMAILLGGGILALLIGVMLFWGYASVRYNMAVKAAEKRGFSLDPEIVFNSGMDDADNFAAHPMFGGPVTEWSEDNSAVFEKLGLDFPEAPEDENGDIIEPPRIPSMANSGGTLDVAGFLAYFDALRRSGMSIPQADPGASPEAQLLKALEWNSAKYDQLINALNERPRGAFLTPDISASLPFTHLLLMMRWNQYLCIKSMAHSLAGDPETALSEIGYSFRIFDITMNDRLAISWLVGLTQLNRITKSIRQCLKSNQLTPQQLDWLYQSLEERNIPALFKEHIKGEVVYMHITWGDPIVVTFDADWKVDLAMHFGPLSLFNKALVIDAMTQHVSGWMESDSPKPSIESFQIPHLQSGSPNIFNALACYSLKMFPTVGERSVFHEEHRRMALTAIALEKYKVSHNSLYPDSLKALAADGVPEIHFTNPRTGNSFIYSVNSSRDSFTLMSAEKVETADDDPPSILVW